MLQVPRGLSNLHVSETSSWDADCTTRHRDAGTSQHWRPSGRTRSHWGETRTMKQSRSPYIVTPSHWHDRWGSSKQMSAQPLLSPGDVPKGNMTSNSEIPHEDLIKKIISNCPRRNHMISSQNEGWTVKKPKRWIESCFQRWLFILFLIINIDSYRSTITLKYYHTHKDDNPQWRWERTDWHWRKQPLLPLPPIRCWRAATSGPAFALVLKRPSHMLENQIFPSVVQQS